MENKGGVYKYSLIFGRYYSKGQEGFAQRGGLEMAIHNLFGVQYGEKLFQGAS